VSAVAGVGKRRYFAPEVVQTSTMDCGPAALKCLLEGFHIPVSYGRLREACQTSVDGTSIDTIEVVARQLGLDAEQMLIPADHVVLPAAQALPALVVVRHADTATHFVVVWRQSGPWLQIMDPSVGRRWVHIRRFQDEIHRHEMSVNAQEWRAWAASEEFLAALRGRLADLGVGGGNAKVLIGEALSDPGWFPIGALDASVRLVKSIAAAGGIKPGPEAERMITALFHNTRDNGEDIFALVPPSYWSATPDASNTDPTREMLKVAGAVLIRVKSKRSQVEIENDDVLPPELAVALVEKPDNPLKTIWRMLREDGLMAPLAVVAAMAVASAALLVEALLFRSLFDIASRLTLPAQRLGAAMAMLVFLGILLLIAMPIALETLRHGRHLETRLRIALLRKLSLLNDRYFQSRPISDMADRNHNIHSIRNVPALGLSFVQTIFELLLTFAGVSVIAPDVALWAFGLLAVAIVIPTCVQPMLNERDLRARNHAGALHGFYLDALLGLAPIRAHRAEKSVSRQHESLLVEWAQSVKSWIVLALVSGAVQSIVCTALSGALLIAHFVHTGRVSGSDLLLVFWALKLPALGSQLAGLAHQYPAQRNVLLRMLEPLSAPEEIDEHSNAPSETPVATLEQGAAIVLHNVSVLAGGHEILRDIDLSIRPGEHVAIVGVSGAGKSSLLGLLLGWHKAASGVLCVDGIALDGTAIQNLRQQTAWVDPAIQIWNRTVLENLEYASDDSALTRIGEVMEAARLRGVVKKLPNGLQTVLGEGGGLLSGGEGQRVRLGRALLATGTRLVLLDEPFRGMDREQRHALLDEARAWWADQTLLCVTHDVGETLHFGRVLVIEDGRIVEDGEPKILASQPSRYRALLDAEKHVRDNLWRGARWRRLDISDGKLRHAKVDA